jgi:hypothetical protein
MFDIADVKPDTAIEAELIGVLERFCSAFADRDAEAVISSTSSSTTRTSSWSPPRNRCYEERPS